MIIDNVIGCSSHTYHTRDTNCEGAETLPFLSTLLLGNRDMMQLVFSLFFFRKYGRFISNQKTLMPYSHMTYATKHPYSSNSSVYIYS